MSLHSFKIELRLDTDDEGQAAVAEIVKEHARQLRASVMFINNNRYRPQVAVTTEDGFYNSAALDLDDQ